MWTYGKHLALIVIHKSVGNDVFPWGHCLNVSVLGKVNINEIQVHPDQEYRSVGVIGEIAVQESNHLSPVGPVVFKRPPFLSGQSNCCGMTKP